MSDYKYYIGSSKQASDYVTVTSYLLNYIRRQFKKGKDIADAIEDGIEMDFQAITPKLNISEIDLTVKEGETPDPKKVAEVDRINKQFEKQYEIEFAAHHEREIQYNDNKAAASALLWNQCANTMKAKIQSRKDYDTEIKDDPIKLLQAIKQHAMSFESTQYRMKTICDSMKTIMNLKQKEDEDGIEYLKRFKASKEVFYSHVGKTFAFPSILEEDPEYAVHQQKFYALNATEQTKAEAKKEVEKICRKHSDQFFAYLYMENTDKAKYGLLLSGLDTQYSLGNKQYPKTMVEAQNVLDNHTFDKAYGERRKKKRQENKQQDKKDNERSEDRSPNMSLAQMKETKPKR